MSLSQPNEYKQKKWWFKLIIIQKLQPRIQKFEELQEKITRITVLVRFLAHHFSEKMRNAIETREMQQKMQQKCVVQY